MDNVTHLGLDVHKESIAVGLLRPTQQIPDHKVIDNTPEAVRKLVSRLDRTSLIACYEAGPTGYDTYRLLDSLGVRCDVIAPALIPRRPGRRIKTDRLDARNLTDSLMERSFEGESYPTVFPGARFVAKLQRWNQ